MIEVVFVARHGETEWNRLGRWQGQLDSPLTEDGLAQARQMAAVVSGLPVDGVFSSPLGRATATAGLLAEKLGMSVTIVEELAEVNHGQMAGLTSSEIEREFPGEMARRAVDKYEWCFPGGESYAEVDRRSAVALWRIATYGVLRPLLVSHEMIGRLLLRNLLQVDPEVALTWNHPHDVIYRVDVASRVLSRVS